MNRQIIGNLIRLRYKLMWAKTRSRNGRIALFFSGYILLILIFGVLITGGIGAGFVAVRSGRGELVARIVLSAVFFQALVATLALGFGLNNLFTDAELRRYPASSVDRTLVRHIVGIADPFWAMYLMLEIGLAIGLYVVGGYGLVRGLSGVLLLFIVNYLLARLIVEGAGRLMRRKSGAIVLMVIIMSVAFLPSVLAQSMKSKPSLGASVAKAVDYTPPFGAAAMMTRPGTQAANGTRLLLVWLAGLLIVSVILEKRPQVLNRQAQSKMSWNSPYERFATLFPAQDAPYVAFWMRFYMRNVRFRTMYLLTLPLMAFLVFNFSRPGRGGGPVSEAVIFQTALGILPIAGFLATSRFTVNQFGYVGGGFRRFFLLPTDPGASLRAGSYASMLMGGWMIPVAVIAFAAFAPGRFDARLLVMLLASGVAGLFLFHALGLWVTLLNPRRGNYENNFGNDLSLGGNLVLIGGTAVSLFLPKLLAKYVPAVVSPQDWWLWLVAPLFTCTFFGISLRAVTPMFHNRRERLLAIAEGRS